MICVKGLADVIRIELLVDDETGKPPQYAKLKSEDLGSCDCQVQSWSPIQRCDEEPCRSDSLGFHIQTAYALGLGRMTADEMLRRTPGTWA